MNEQIFGLEERFQPSLVKNDYTFVGSADVNLMPNFIEVANQMALLTLPKNAELRIYVTISNGASKTLPSFDKTYNKIKK